MDRFLTNRSGHPALARTRSAWQRIRARTRPDCVSTVYALLPCAALEAAGEAGTLEAGPIPYPRFPLDSLQALAVAAYTAVDALGGRRNARVPAGATLQLLTGAD